MHHTARDSLLTFSLKSPEGGRRWEGPLGLSWVTWVSFSPSVSKVRLPPSSVHERRNEMSKHGRGAVMTINVSHSVAKM